MKLWMSCIVLMPLLAAQAVDCPKPVPLPLTGWPVAFDPNRIVMEYPADPNRPAPARRLLRAPFLLTLGRTAVISDGWFCDPDGDRMNLTATKGVISISPNNGTWSWSYRPAAIGIEYIDLTVTDIRPTGDAYSSSGTIVVKTVPGNRPPEVGCGARP